MKITKEEFNSLYSDTITKKQYDETISKINKRFIEIVIFILGDKKGSFSCDYYNTGRENKLDGFFDLEEHREYISICGENCDLPEPYWYENSFPTRWLWEDFEDEFKAEVKKWKDIELEERKWAKLNKESYKDKLKKLKQSIKSKLTKEELKVIKFK